MTVTPFAKRLSQTAVTLKRDRVETLQVNIGKLCNQACSHCHVEAGPTKKRENMDLSTVNRILELMAVSSRIKALDITGGAPELNPHFRTLVRESFRLDVQTIDRCNLTVLQEEGQEDTPQFLAEYRVKIVASLPCYSLENVEKQRGKGVFGKSIESLKLLNSLGYGRPGSGLSLDLVYNPLGPSLPPPQDELRAKYKRELKDVFDIDFNDLLCITNMPIKRFRRDLIRLGAEDRYMQLLSDNFNVSAVDRVMCRTLVSVSWDGRLYDCDFNQMLDLPCGNRHRTIWDLNSFDDVCHDLIVTANHCYGCTAGAGSSCGGALT